MRKYLVISILLAGTSVLPCAAEVKDAASALAALKSDAAKDRLDAVAYLGARRTPEAYEALAKHFQTEKDAYLRVQIVEALDVSVSTWAASCAAAAADDSNKAVRQAAAMPLSRLPGSQEAEKKLKALAADPSDAVRLAVVNSLSVNTSTSSVAILGGVLSDQKSAPAARRAAARGLSGMKTPAADAELGRHVSDADPEIKAAAVSRRPSKTKPAKKK